MQFFCQYKPRMTSGLINTTFKTLKRGCKCPLLCRIYGISRHTKELGRSSRAAPAPQRPPESFQLAENTGAEPARRGHDAPRGFGITAPDVLIVPRAQLPPRDPPGRGNPGEAPLPRDTRRDRDPAGERHRGQPRSPRATEGSASSLQTPAPATRSAPTAGCTERRRPAASPGRTNSWAASGAGSPGHAPPRAPLGSRSARPEPPPLPAPLTARSAAPPAAGESRRPRPSLPPLPVPLPDPPTPSASSSSATGSGTCQSEAPRPPPVLRPSRPHRVT